MQDKLSRRRILLYLLGTLPVIWLGLLIAPYLPGGLPALIRNFGNIVHHPFAITFCEDSLRAVLIFLLAYGLGLMVYLSTSRNYRRRQEHGSAKWGSAEAVNKKYADRKWNKNKVLTRHVSLGLDGRKHRRNLNILCCGGSGAGKTRFFAKINLMNAACSYVVLDPKSEMLRDCGNLLKQQGYHGMTAEQFAWAWLRSEVLEPRHYYSTPRNTYYEFLQGVIESKEKEELERHD